MFVFAKKVINYSTEQARDPKSDTCYMELPAFLCDAEFLLCPDFTCPFSVNSSFTSRQAGEPDSFTS